MNINKLGMVVVVAFAGWCAYRGLSEPNAWNDYMAPATLAVLIGGVFAFNLGRNAGKPDE
jgi:hypothetical protein